MNGIDQRSYITHLVDRMTYQQAVLEKLMRLPMNDTHEPTGLPVWHVVVLLIEGIGWSNHELLEEIS